VLHGFEKQRKSSDCNCCKKCRNWTMWAQQEQRKLARVKKGERRGAEGKKGLAREEEGGRKGRAGGGGLLARGTPWPHNSQAFCHNVLTDFTLFWPQCTTTSSLVRSGTEIRRKGRKVHQHGVRKVRCYGVGKVHKPGVRKIHCYGARKIHQHKVRKVR
jgi:hypothetical protein